MDSLWPAFLFPAAVLSAIVPLKAATLSHSTSAEGRKIFTLTGAIVEGDAGQLAEAVAYSPGVLGPAIRLNSPGGALVEGAKLSAVVRSGKIATVVMRDTMCASACFMVFAAESEKYASYGAKIGVHGASTKSGDETVDAPTGTVASAKWLSGLGVPPGIIGKMVVTPPDQMVWLSPGDLESMGVQMTGTPGQGLEPTPPDQGTD